MRLARNGRRRLRRRGHVVLTGPVPPLGELPLTAAKGEARGHVSGPASTISFGFDGRLDVVPFG